MEVEITSSPGYDTTHPNYERWRRAREISIERGNFVKSVVSKFTDCRGLKILDVGSGEGSTAKIFAGDSFVVSLERNPIRLNLQNKSDSLSLVSGDAKALPFKSESFDLIIFQDSIEHIGFTNNSVHQYYNLLKREGIIYISTPNKFSILNILSDPHWGLPLVSLLKRKQIKKYFLKHFRKNDYERDDIAELYSMNDLFNKFHQRFQIFLNTKFAVTELISGNKGLIWSNFHLNILKIIRKLRISRFLVYVANDKHGLINKFITLTFYLILKKK